jgi:hypothetical protein
MASSRVMRVRPAPGSMPTIVLSNIIGVVGQVGDGVDVVDVGRDGDLERALVVPDRQALEVVAVLLPVVLVGGGQPRIEEQVEVAPGHTGIDGGRRRCR